MTVNVGVVKVPDDRHRADRALQAQTQVPADVTYVDLPGAADLAGRPRAGGVTADQLARLRTTDCCSTLFARSRIRPCRTDGSVDAWRDLERLDLEFVLADLSVMEKRIEKLQTSGRHGTPAEREQNERGFAVLEKLAPALRGESPSAISKNGDDEQKRIRGFRFLTEKPVLVLLNVGGRGHRRASEIASELAARYQHSLAQVEALSAKIEMEIGQLDDEEASVFRERWD